jgi:hypothetical protein
MSTNFPVVRLTSASGTVTYARTFFWSSVGVQTRNKRVSTMFALPSGLASGIYRLQVIASGIASRSVIFTVK